MLFMLWLHSAPIVSFYTCCVWLLTNNNLFAPKFTMATLRIMGSTAVELSQENIPGYHGSNLQCVSWKLSIFETVLIIYWIEWTLIWEAEVIKSDIGIVIMVECFIFGEVNSLEQFIQILCIDNIIPEQTCALICAFCKWRYECVTDDCLLSTWPRCIYLCFMYIALISHCVIPEILDKKCL